MTVAALGRRLAPELLVVAFFAAVAAAWWWPLPLHFLDGQLEQPPLDSAYNQWLLGWGSHALTTDPLSYFDANAYHPHQGILAWGDHLFGLALVGLPFRPLLGLVGTYNLLLLASTGASGYACYLLVRLLTGRRAVSVLAGALWVVGFYRTLEYSHLQVLSTQWVPLVFLFAENLRRSARLRHVVGLAVSAWLVLATNVYLAVYTVLGFCLYALVVFVGRRIDLRVLVRIGGAWAVALVLALPLYVPAIRLQARRQVVRSLDEQSPMTLEAFRPLPPPGQRAQILSDWFGDRLIYGGNYATPGLVLLVLIAIAVAAGVTVVRRRRSPRDDGVDRRAGLALGAVAALALISAQGPYFQWHGRRLADNPVFLVAYHLVPGYDALRIPHRWLLFAFFGMAVAAGTVAAAVFDRLPRPTRIAGVVALVAASIVELAPAPWPVFPSYTTADEPVYAWLEDQPDAKVIVELPISADVASRVTQELEAKRLYFSALHLRDRVGGGISPYIEASYLENAALVNELGRDPDALAALRRWGVDLVLFDATDQTRYEGAEAPAAVITRLDAEPGLRRIAEAGDTTVYRVLPTGPGTPGS